jgi:hypothetical protein
VIEFVANAFRIFQRRFTYTGDLREVEFYVEVQGFILGDDGNHIVGAVNVSHRCVGLVPFVSEEVGLLLSLGFKEHCRKLVVRLAGNLITSQN